MSFLGAEGHTTFPFRPCVDDFKATLRQFTDLPSPATYSGALYSELSNAESFHNLFVREARSYFYNYFSSMAYEDPAFKGVRMELMHGQMEFVAGMMESPLSQPLTSLPEQPGVTTLQVVLNCCEGDMVFDTDTGVVNLPAGSFLVVRKYAHPSMRNQDEDVVTWPAVQLLRFGVRLSSLPTTDSFIPNVDAKMVNGSVMPIYTGDMPMMYPFEASDSRLIHTIAATFPDRCRQTDGSLKVISPDMEFPPAYSMTELSMYKPHYVYSDDLVSVILDHQPPVFMSPPPKHRRGPIIDPITGTCY